MREKKMKNTNMLVLTVALNLITLITVNIPTEPTAAQEEEEEYIGPGRIDIDAGEYIYYEFPALNIPEISSIYFYGTVGVTGGIIPNILVQLYDSETGQMYINRLTTYDDFGVYLPMGREYILRFENTALLAGETKHVNAEFSVRPMR
jgi:hypothetical protein